MFEISFGELLIIGTVALLVLGPEKLPKVARTIGHLVGRLQRFVQNVKGDIQREMDLQHLREVEQEMAEANRQLTQTISAAEQSVQDIANPLLNPPTVELAEAETTHLETDGADTATVQAETPHAPSMEEQASKSLKTAVQDDRQFDLFAADAPPANRSNKDRR